MRGFNTDDANANGTSNGTFKLAPFQQSLVITVKDHQLKYSYIWSELTSMDLAVNGLTGNIPTNIVDLSKLVFLNLSSNAFTGTIPPELGDLPLQSLDLSSNFLSSDIPPSLGKSGSYLSTLALANNNLSGQIPQGTEIQSMKASSFLPGNDGLCGPPLVNRPCTLLTTDNTSQASEFSDLIAAPAFAVGIVVGFVSFAAMFLMWSPARDFIKLLVLTQSPRRAESLWRGPM